MEWNHNDNWCKSYFSNHSGWWQIFPNSKWVRVFAIVSNVQHYVSYNNAVKIRDIKENHIFRNDYNLNIPLLLVQESTFSKIRKNCDGTKNVTIIKTPEKAFISKVIKNWKYFIPNKHVKIQLNIFCRCKTDPTNILAPIEVFLQWWMICDDLDETQ